MGRLVHTKPRILDKAWSGIQGYTPEPHILDKMMLVYETSAIGNKLLAVLSGIRCSIAGGTFCLVYQAPV